MTSQSLSNENEKYLRYPASLALQIHITTRCQYNCPHCYYNSLKLNKHVDLNIRILSSLIHSFAKFVYEYDLDGYIYFTGGDPLLYPDLLKLMELLKKIKRKYNEYLTLGILGNPGIIVSNQNIIEKLRKTGFDTYQLSMDGIQTTHDKLRGNGSFKKTLKALEMLSLHRFNTVIMTTVSNINIEEVSSVLETAAMHGARVFDFAPYVPLGRLGVDVLPTPEDYRMMLIKVLMKYISLRERGYEIILGLKDPLWNLLLYELGMMYVKINSFLPRCSYGVTTIAVEVNGDIYPCRRLPIVVGNIYKLFETLRDKGLNPWEELFRHLYFNLNTLNELREMHAKLHECNKCPLFNFCGGGHACLSQALYNNFLKKSPLCWRNYTTR